MQYQATLKTKLIYVFSIDDYREFFSSLEPDDEICVCGGDGRGGAKNARAW